MTSAPAVSPDDVLTFWRQAGPSRWFAKDEAFDATFRQRFEAAHEAAASGRLAAWEESADGALALLVLLDQFPRNAYRGTARMFATDAQALDLAKRAVERAFPQSVEPGLRGFFHLPFSHSEELADQRRAVELNADADANWLHFARIHLEVIERFGRFPHRNAVLGRVTTPAEQQFLDEGGFAG